MLLVVVLLLLMVSYDLLILSFFFVHSIILWKLKIIIIRHNNIICLIVKHIDDVLYSLRILLHLLYKALHVVRTYKIILVLLEKLETLSKLLFLLE